MATSAPTTHCWRFGLFEVDAHREELRRAGVPLKVREQPFRILVFLLEHNREIVTREQLRAVLWPQDVFVDFDHSLNTAMMKLREALGDTAEKPLYIETVPRKGYRFVAPVTGWDGTARAGESAVAVNTGIATRPAASAPVAVTTTVKVHARRRWLWWVSGVAVFFGAALFLWYASQPLPPPHISQTVSIADVARHGDTWPIGTDGGRIFLTVQTPESLGQMPVSGGEITTTSIQIPDRNAHNAGAWLGPVSPDGNSVLAYGKYDPKANMSDLWVAATLGSPIRHLTRAVGLALSAAWSPDGSQVIYSTADWKVYTIPSAGGAPHLLRALDGWAGFFAYSPNGSHIRFTYSPHNTAGRIWEMSSKGENLHEVFPHWHPADDMYAGSWTPDGDFFLFLASGPRFDYNHIASQIWASDERRAWLHRRSREPVQLTSLPSTWYGPVPSRDAQKIFAYGREYRGQLTRYNRGTKQLEPYLDGMPAEMLDFSRDGKFVVYDTYPDAILWRANRDGSGIQQVARAPSFYPVNPRISPDDSQIVFSDLPRDGQGRRSVAYLVSSQGGVPAPLLPGDTLDESDPTWSPDGKVLAITVGSNSAQPSRAVRIVDLATRTTTNLPPAPRHVFSSRWSPDGRYIACLTIPDVPKPADGIEVYDFRTRQWTVILDVHAALWAQSPGWLTWSPDSRWIDYTIGGVEHNVAWRISVNGGKPALIADFPDLKPAGFFGNWFGMDPEGNPLMLRDTGTTDIYALTLER